MCSRKILGLIVICTVAPLVSHAQGMANSVYSLNEVLDRLFDEMLPLCGRLIGVGRVIAGFAALWYIAFRVWKHIAKAESIDFFPLLRPFAIGMTILLFPQVIALMNGVLKPVVVATKAMSEDSHKAILYNIEQQEKAVKETPPVSIYPGGNDDMEKYEQPDGSSDESGFFSGLKSAFSIFNIKSMIKVFISEVMQMLYAAAALCINTVRTFYLLILAILGPLVLGLSVFDGFQHTLSSWFARYINVFMWLPVANIFGAITSKILENMMTLDHDFSSSVAYIIFMIISIVGYTTVPNVAGYIIQAGGKDTLLHKVNQMTQTAGKAALASVL
ncbi:conjugative transposon protein TraJ [Pedobacter borealis]|uniref:conjugative transposon protein TraJ n=1 Tax=Pedobacter borealis TaxID=475254 RepID=UPI0006914861|nr:conjugative transposon protein TraJ [Pedobacter borealis]